MKRIRRKVTAADESGASKLQDMIDRIQDDFEYIIAGLEKLDRTSASESNDGLIIAEGLNASLQDVIAQIAEKVS